jgi:8-oxo-dGTP diphosphatase
MSACGPSERPEGSPAKPGPRARIDVVAAVVERDGRFLVTRRQPGVHLEGYWEFPGGKCEPGEAHDACLARELREELGVAMTIGGLILSVSHDYPDRAITLHFYACAIDGEPRSLLGQEIRWASRDELKALEFPPADADLIRTLAQGFTNGSRVTSADPPDDSSTRVPGSADSRGT